MLLLKQEGISVECQLPASWQVNKSGGCTMRSKLIKFEYVEGCVVRSGVRPFTGEEVSTTCTGMGEACTWRLGQDLWTELRMGRHYWKHVPSLNFVGWVLNINKVNCFQFARKWMPMIFITEKHTFTK